MTTRSFPRRIEHLEQLAEDLGASVTALREHVGDMPGGKQAIPVYRSLRKAEAALLEAIAALRDAQSLSTAED